METRLLVFDDGNGDDLDLRAFVDGLDDNAEMIELEAHVCFVRSGLSVSELSNRFIAVAGSRVFFISDIASSKFEGRMPGVYWDFIKNKSLASAAE
ncbi:hypothetical protein [Rhodopseudomonas palustris]|uniref:Uncharacterized protein n=1 Tax=Rhodopseudomonas palustris (strain BisB18) TaxID=316056 RepID=Q21CK2_RHOPB